MDNFVFQNPTKIIFGKGVENQAGQETARYSKKILLHYGGNSAKHSGLYNRVTASLKEAGVDFVELGGVKPNPRLSLVREGIKICREQGVGFVLAVGGGSVIDSAKAIAIGVPYPGDVWDFYTGKAKVKEALPTGTILTIPAAGSEASRGSVITNEDGWYKRSADDEVMYPRFSILNPEMAFTLPKFQVGCGAADIMAHLLERYFTNTQHVEFIDRLIESALKTIVHNAPIVLAQPENYAAWAEIMWAGTIAHNDLLGTGRVGDWASHQIEHEVSGIYDVAHGAGLAVIFPAWMKYVYKHDLQRFSQIAVRVWNVDQNFWSAEETALEGIRSIESFFQSIGLATTLTGLGITDDRLDEMANKCTGSGMGSVGNFVPLKKADVYHILKLAQ
jgi:alcohol dehydrogenase